MPKGERAGFPTYWTTFGQGPRRALMIHCSLAHSGAWGGLARHLSGALTMTAFDLPGHGRSAGWDGRGEVQGVAAGIAASFCEEPVDVIGHSFGATVALRLAVERPELVRSLVLIEPVWFRMAECDAAEVFADHVSRMAPYAAALEAGDRLEAARIFTGLWGDGTPWEAIPPAQAEALAAQVPLVEAGAEALYGDPGAMLERLGELRCPVLLIAGSESPPVIEAIHDGLAARIAQAERAVVVGAGHMVPITHAGQVSREVLRFLQTS
ncbi:alpha/beta hydrolase [Roseovarius faecimaris]|uniref:Alpha/beta hydrolase n=2 Tax=Roseovarius faecimaris TaxID=2494550 RepID=A0A6I6INK0_9RHOB|nr:alpha/beta hydrolase [Roseovarius faecimaris]